MLRKAQRGGYAVGAFNIENLEMAQAVLMAAEAMGSPVILQTTPGTLLYAPPGAYAGMVQALVPKGCAVALHLDHGNSLAQVQACLDAGYTSIMMDGSKLPFDENIALTKRVVTMAGEIPVEAELGLVGGKEDSLEETCAQYTDPEQAEEFMGRTGAFSLAVGIGTAHGLYQGKPHLKIPLVSQIAARISAPLVLHGTSGVDEDEVRDCIRCGICKVNYATDLRQAYTLGIQETLAASPGVLDPKAYGKQARNRVFTLVCERIRMLGSKGKAGADTLR